MRRVLMLSVFVSLVVFVTLAIVGAHAHTDGNLRGRGRRGQEQDS